MRKSKTGQMRIPSPFETTTTKTERSAVAILMHWMRQIIEKGNLDLGLPDVDTSGADRKSPDVIIYESRRSRNVLCVIEAKPPYHDVFNHELLKNPAWEKANNRRARYFATTNFQELVWFSTEKANAMRPAEEQVVDKYHISELEDLNLIEETRYKETIIKQLETFLTKLYAVHIGKEPEPKQAIDEFLTYRLHDKIRRLARYYAAIIESRCHQDKAFSSKLSKFFKDQGWSFAWQPQDFDKAARQTAYLLVNKILFYDLLQAKRPEKLDPLQIPQGLTKGAQLQKILQSFFDEVLKIDYETIYTTDFVDDIAFPDEKEIVAEVRELVSILQGYDFSKLGYDIIGGIFQKLIPQDERHNLGQYFTNPDVVDLILCFCLKNEGDQVFDPSCGAGTFLVRAYQHKKLMNQYLMHQDILETLWGNDIAKFPAHLSTINLAINDLSVDRNYPNIMQEDFFDFLATDKGFDMPQKWRRVRAKTLGVKVREIEYPSRFDCIVGNPPYTRQEEIAAIAPEDRHYKGTLIDRALQDINGRKIAEIPRRAGIYAYFFVHGAKFLRNGGRFGFVVSESWLDVDYGKGLQEFFLNQYKIIAIIGSKVERWFEDADINTCIVILEKCSGDDRHLERDDNLVRFVYLKKPLRYFIPPAQDIWEKQVERIKTIKDMFIRTILAHSDPYEGDDFRIFPKNQKELWEEGYDPKEHKYTGSKWGNYLRVSLPEIYLRIHHRKHDLFARLHHIADVNPGCYTGINDFFYFERRPQFKDEVENEFLIPVIRNTRQIKSMYIEPGNLDTRVFVCRETREELAEKGKTNALEYIKWGETQVTRRRQKVEAGVHWTEVETVKIRKPGWWAIPVKDVKPAQVFMIYVINDRFITSFSKYPIASDRCFHRIFPSKEYDGELLTAILNSTLTIFNIEAYGRSNLGLGALKFEAMDAKQIPIVNPKVIPLSLQRRLKIAFEEVKDREVGTIFSEIGADTPSEVSLDKVKPDRRKIDSLIMGEILGLTDDEQLDVYRAVVDLVKSRLEKAKSIGKRQKSREGIDIDLLIRVVMEKVGNETLGTFYEEKVLSQETLQTKNLPKPSSNVSIQQSLLGWRLYSGKESLDCASELEARYLKIWLGAGLDKVKIPLNEDYLRQIVPQLEGLKQKIDEIIAHYLDSVLNVKMRDRILRQLWYRIVSS